MRKPAKRRSLGSRLLHFFFTSASALAIAAGDFIVRNPDDAAMDRAEAAFAAFLHDLEAEHDGRLTATTQRLALTRAVDFDEGLRGAVAAAADDLGYSRRSLRSGAGHDAQELAHIGRAAMIFVPGEHEGISHNPREYSTPEACRRGIDVLATVAVRLAR